LRLPCSQRPLPPHSAQKTRHLLWMHTRDRFEASSSPSRSPTPDADGPGEEPAEAAGGTRLAASTWALAAWLPPPPSTTPSPSLPSTGRPTAAEGPRGTPRDKAEGPRVTPRGGTPTGKPICMSPPCSRGGGGGASRAFGATFSISHCRQLVLISPCSHV